jgi:hypothetical protein
VPFPPPFEAAMTIEEYRQSSANDHAARIAGEYGDTGKGADPVEFEYGSLDP